MNNATLTTRLILLLALPFLGVAVFGVRSAWDKGNAVAVYARLRSSNTVANQLGNLVHELQRERGRSAVFIGNKGARFAVELPEQQRATDAAWQRLREILPAF